MKKILIDAHTHTVASGHAYSSLQEMVKAAVMHIYRFRLPTMSACILFSDFPDDLIMNYWPERFFEYLGI